MNDIERRLSMLELSVAEMSADVKTLKTFVMNDMEFNQKLIIGLLGVIGAVVGIKALI